MRTSLNIAAAAIALLATAGMAPEGAPRPGSRPELAYSLVEGQNLNAFTRQGKVAAHLLLRNGTEPRILVAFPAGNSGVGLWFNSLPTAARWTLDRAPQPITLHDRSGRQLYGISFDASTSAPRLTVKQAVLSNVRFLRDYQAVGRTPAEIAVSPQVNGGTLVFARDRVDGAPGYRLDIRPLDGKVQGGSIVAGPDGRIRLRVAAASGDTPLTPLTTAELLTPTAANDPAARQALTFLSYREKFLAGSWRFNTYFGRDTLMSVRLLMPVLRGAAVESGLSAVLARLNNDGEVAHEEGPSEFAIIDHRQHGHPGGAAPTLDYGMIDGNYLLGPVSATYLLEHADRSASARFLARPIASESQPGSSERAGALLVRNLRYVLAKAAPFAAAPARTNLVAIKPGRMTGEWRDSEEGLGRGRYPYDVNAVLVPAALEAADRLFRAGLLAPYVSNADRTAFAHAGQMARIWQGQAPGMFAITTPAAEAAARIRAYGNQLGIPVTSALAALGQAPLRTHAISLDAQGQPVPIINSDEGFMLLFGQSSPADLDLYVGALARPFPAGLMTDIGMLVANPVLADAATQARFTPAAYHGTVVWSWQQALFAAGLERQLARHDLPASTRASLRSAQAQLWRAIQATRAVSNSELWSWRFANGKYQVVPFGAGAKDVDESNAAQLWSTVYLGVKPPADLSAPKRNP